MSYDNELTLIDECVEKCKDAKLFKVVVKGLDSDDEEDEIIEAYKDFLKVLPASNLERINAISEKLGYDPKSPEDTTSFINCLPPESK